MDPTLGTEHTKVESRREADREATYLCASAVAELLSLCLVAPRLSEVKLPASLCQRPAYLTNMHMRMHVHVHVHVHHICMNIRI